MIGVVGIKAIHAGADGLPEFVSGLNDIADAATGVALSTPPDLFQGVADTALDLLCPTLPITIAGHAIGDYERLERPRARRVAAQLRVGLDQFNGSPMDLSAPFGGYKASCTSREFGECGLAAFMEHKTMVGCFM